MPSILRIRSIFLRAALPFALGLVAIHCKSEGEQWETSPGVQVTVFKEIENGKPYLTVLYENFGTDTVEKIRYQLINETRGHLDTVWKEIDPPKLLRPKDRHSVPRHIGEDTVSAEYVHVGQVLVVKDHGK
jgi:hypothetical protein